MIELRRRLVVLENFYGNPDQIRAAALAEPFFSPAAEGDDDIFGWRSRRAFGVTPDVKRVLESVLGIRISGWTDRGARALDNGVFFVTTASGTTKERIHPHYDGDGTMLTGVIYMTPDAPHDAGTSFFKHKATGLDHMPDDGRWIRRQLGISATRLREMIFADGFDMRRWTETDRIANRYNRAVFFPPNLFHSGRGYFGSDLHSGRLYQSFHVETWKRRRNGLPGVRLRLVSRRPASDGS